MSNGKLTTIARPYALAAFEVATAKKAVPAWDAMLQSAAVLVQNPLMQKLLGSPKATAPGLYALFCDILAKTLDTEKKNFLHLLADNKRLLALPDIAALFQAYRAAAEKTVTVEVTSAVPLEENYRSKLIKALHARLQRQIDLHCEVDPTLIGGAVIRAGDTVIDGSIRGKLARLIEFI